MTPQETPTTPPTNPSDTTPPAETQPVPASSTPSQPAVPVAATPSGKSNKKTSLIAIIAGVVVVVLLLVAGWFTLWSPQAKAKRLSNSFMHAITTGDVDKAVEVSGDSSNEAFLEKAAPSVKGSYKMVDSTYQDSKGYYLYSLSGADKDYARTIIAKEDGKLQVTSFVYSNTKLRLIPGTSEDTSSEQTTTTKDTPTTTASCLVKSDYDAFGWTNTIDYTTDSPKTGNVHFLTDSLQYEDDTQTKLLEPLVDFYKATASKDYTIHLYGSVATTSEADKTFANQRAEKVKSDLVSMGIPASKFVIDAPTNANDVGGVDNDVAAQMNRAVVWSVIPGCTGSSSSSSSTGK